MQLQLRNTIICGQEIDFFLVFSTFDHFVFYYQNSCLFQSKPDYKEMQQKDADRKTDW